MRNSIFDVFGLDVESLTKSFEDFNLHDVIKNNKNIHGAFDKLSESEQKKVVESMNKIQNSFDSLFGGKSVEWTVDDFKGATVDVNVSGDESESKCDTKDNKKVYTKPDTTICAEKGSECSDDEEFKPLDECLYDEGETEDECDVDAPDCADCQCRECPNNWDCEDMPCKYCCCADDEEAEDDDCSKGVHTICDDLLAELEAEDTSDELDVDAIADYVVSVLRNKKDKKYVLHPAVNNIPAAVEVNVPKSVVNPKIVNNIHTVTLLHDVLIDMIGAKDAYISANDKTGGLTIYIPLTEKTEKTEKN